MKRLLLPACAFLLVVGCASNPVLTGKPQDWQGHPADDLKAAWGPPTKITPQSNGTEIWEYSKSGEFVAPKEENTSFNLGGAGNSGFFGASGGVTTQKYDQRLSRFENIARFEIRNGKIKKWYTARIVDGRTVWEDH